MEDNKNKKASEMLSNIWSKTADVSKKTVDGIQKGAKAFSEKSKADRMERMLKKLDPITPKDFKNKKFNIPNVIRIVDDAERRGNELCEGAIGYRETEGDVEILALYDEWVPNCGLKFVPAAKCYDVYCVDPFDRSRFIRSDCIFSKINEERLAELAHVAHYLGAKMCSIEILESNNESNSSKLSAAVKASGIGTNMDVSNSNSNSSCQSGKTVSYFEGSDIPRRPNLKWFADDDNIKGLIEMRCTENNSIKSKMLEIKGTSTETMSQKMACAIDKILKIKGSISMEKQVLKEHSSSLIFSIEF